MLVPVGRVPVGKAPGGGKTPGGTTEGVGMTTMGSDSEGVALSTGATTGTSGSAVGSTVGFSDTVTVCATVRKVLLPAFMIMFFTHQDHIGSDNLFRERNSNGLCSWASFLNAAIFCQQFLVAFQDTNSRTVVSLLCVLNRFFNFL